MMFLHVDQKHDDDDDDDEDDEDDDDDDDDAIPEHSLLFGNALKTFNNQDQVNK